MTSGGSHPAVTLPLNEMQARSFDLIPDLWLHFWTVAIFFRREYRETLFRVAMLELTSLQLDRDNRLWLGAIESRRIVKSLERAA